MKMFTNKDFSKAIENLFLQGFQTHGSVASCGKEQYDAAMEWSGVAINRGSEAPSDLAIHRNVYVCDFGVVTFGWDETLDGMPGFKFEVMLSIPPEHTPPSAEEQKNAAALLEDILRQVRNGKIDE